MRVYGAYGGNVVGVWECRWGFIGRMGAVWWVFESVDGCLWGVWGQCGGCNWECVLCLWVYIGGSVVRC